MGSGGVPGMSQVELTLGHFECKSTTESGTDELLLEIRLDDAHREPYPYMWEFGQGAILDIDRTYVFDDKIELRLLEGDTVFDDDLGTKTLETGEPMGDEVTFDNGAEYVLEYEVTSVSGVNPVDHAIDAFEASGMAVRPDGTNQGMGTIWPEIEKSKLVSQLRDTVGSSGNPNVLDQGNTPFCGFIAVAYGLATRQPRRLVEIVRGLFETGETLTVDDRIWLSDDFKTDEVKSDTRELDWMLAGSLREAANLLLDVQNDSYLDGKSALIHAAMPWTISGLLGATLDFENVDWAMDEQVLRFVDPWELIDYSPIQPTDVSSIPTVTTDDVLNRAAEAHNNGGVGVLLIEKELIDGGTADVPNNPNPINQPEYPRAEYPNHYVTLISDPAVGNQYTFEVQSWGGRGLVDMAKADCEDYIWGVARAYP